MSVLDVPQNHVTFALYDQASMLSDPSSFGGASPWQRIDSVAACLTLYAAATEYLSQYGVSLGG